MMTVVSILCGLAACGTGGSGPGGNAGGGGAGKGPGTGGASSGGSGAGSGGIGSGGLAGSASAGTGGGGGETGHGGATGSAGAGGRPSPDGGSDASVDKQPMSGTPCASNAECGGEPSRLYCRPPGEPLGCAGCQIGKDQCVTDTDCASDGGVTAGHMICDLSPSSLCYCAAIKICQVGCRANTDCMSGQACNSLHKCQSTCVPGGGTCPVDTTCGTTGFCQRSTCANDSQCSGACVGGGCYGSRGMCQVPPL
jgi:hypothetical protein